MLFKKTYFRCKDSVEFSLECCWLLDAYGANIFRKFEQRSHGHHLRQSILNEFRERSDDLKAAAIASPHAQRYFRALSEASKVFGALPENPVGQNLNSSLLRSLLSLKNSLLI